MQVIFIPKPGIDLYRTFLLSETSRMILRFYAPYRRDDGCVEVPVATLGSGLSLASELRWYIRRYTADLLFQTQDDQLISYKLAKEIYDRSLPYPGADWPFWYAGSLLQAGGQFRRPVLCLEEEMGKETPAPDRGDEGA